MEKKTLVHRVCDHRKLTKCIHNGDANVNEYDQNVEDETYDAGDVEKPNKGCFCLHGTEKGKDMIKANDGEKLRDQIPFLKGDTLPPTSVIIFFVFFWHILPFVSFKEKEYLKKAIIIIRIIII